MPRVKTLRQLADVKVELVSFSFANAGNRLLPSPNEHDGDMQHGVQQSCVGAYSLGRNWPQVNSCYETDFQILGVSNKTPWLSFPHRKTFHYENVLFRDKITYYFSPRVQHVAGLSNRQL